MTQNWGATPEDWAHFSTWLGLTEYLLPVVSNPAAQISPDSKMKGLGKTPSWYNGRREVAGIPSWTQHKATDATVRRWAKDADYGICLKTGLVIALDIDIDGPGPGADAIAAVAAEHLGALPCRSRAGSGKRLLAFRITDAPALNKRSFRTADGLVEFLATGQQFVAVGTHTSGARYEWAGGLPDEFPAVAIEDFEALWADLVARFAIAPATGGALRRRGAEITGLDDPVAAWLADHDLILDQGRDGALYVDCPWKHEHTTDSGVTETAWFPAGTNGYEQGHFKCLHAHCDGRTDADFEIAIGYRANDFENLPAVTDEQEAVPVSAPRRLVRDGKGQIEATIHNLVIALEASDWTGWQIARDTFLDEIMWAPIGTDRWRVMTDEDRVALRLWLERRAFKAIKRDDLRDVVRMIARERSFDSAQLWLNSLQWDGVPRVAGFLSEFLGAQPSDYARAVSLYWWTAHAGRVLEPGCKCDMVPILVSQEGRYKSSMLEAMVPAVDHFVELDLAHKDADLSRKMRGKLLGELAELRGLRGRGAEANKAWVTRRFEEWTPKYVESTTRLMRRLVFVGTTNSDDIIDETTGDRRWLPIRIGTGDMGKIAAQRDQLWAEAREMFKRGGVAWQDAYRLGPAHRDEFKVVDIWEPALLRWLGTAEGTAKAAEGFTLEDAFFYALGGDATKRALHEQQRLGNVLRGLGAEKRNKRVNGRQAKVWIVRQFASDALRYFDNGNQGSSEKLNDYADLA